MWVFPLAAALVSAAFAVRVARGWVRERRPSMAAWAAALLLFAVAAAAMSAGMILGWGREVFLVYYVGGAVLTAPVLAIGTIYVLAPRPVAHLCAVAIGAACAVSAVILVTTAVNAAALETTGIPHGGDVLDLSTRNLSRVLSYGGYIVVAGGALWSAIRFARRRDERSRALSHGNALIAAGTTIVAIGSGTARLGHGETAGAIFSVALLVGVSIMFAGFLQTTSWRRGSS